MTLTWWRWRQINIWERNAKIKLGEEAETSLRATGTSEAQVNRLLLETHGSQPRVHGLHPKT